jgi:hypothetical protein
MTATSKSSPQTPSSKEQAAKQAGEDTEWTNPRLPAALGWQEKKAAAFLLDLVPGRAACSLDF